MKRRSSVTAKILNQMKNEQRISVLTKTNRLNQLVQMNEGSKQETDIEGLMLKYEDSISESS